jgi:hypothetical protein
MKVDKTDEIIETKVGLSLLTIHAGIVAFAEFFKRGGVFSLDDPSKKLPVNEQTVPVLHPTGNFLREKK